jgi:chromosome segregation ATPase
MTMSLFLTHSFAETKNETIAKDQAKIQSNMNMISAKNKVLVAKQKQITALKMKINSLQFQYGYSLGTYKAVGISFELNEAKANLKTLNIEMEALAAEVEAYQAENEALTEEIKTLQN